MFIGHGLLAFTLVAALVWRVGPDPRRALALGAVAGLFATAPDVDVVYGLAGLAGGVAGPEAVLGTFFETGNVTHRGPTHSLIVGAIAAAAFGLLRVDAAPYRAAGLAGLGGVIALVITTGTWLDAGVTAIFVLVGIAIVAGARRLDVGARAVAATAAVGLLSHPFGDLFTGTPPDLLYPFDTAVVGGQIALHADPTIHLLATFALELAIVWAAVVTTLRLTGRDVGGLIDRKAAAGVAYGAGAVMIPAPTVASAEPFVFSVLAVGAVGAAPAAARLQPALARAVVSALATVTCAAGAYAVVYLLA